MNEPSTKTVTLPDLPPAAPRDDADMVVALREMERDCEHVLSLERVNFTVGSAEPCDVRVVDRHVSAQHCLLARRGQRLRVVDQDSHNGTYFGGRRERTFDLGPGDVFKVAGVSLMAMTAEMREAHAVLSEVVDSGASARTSVATVDWILAEVLKGGHVLMLGEPACDQERLARAIHAASYRRHAPFQQSSVFPAERLEQRKMLDKARNTSLFFVVRHDSTPPDEAFRSMLLSADFCVRLLVSAPSLAVAVNCFGLEATSRMRQILICPVRERMGQVPLLLDRFLEEQGSSLRIADLTKANQRALLSHKWPENLEELHDAAARMAALAKHGSMRKAALALDMARTTLQSWLDRIMLELPLDGKTAGVDSDGIPQEL